MSSEGKGILPAYDDVLTENKQLRQILAQNPQLYQQFYKEECTKALKATTLFSTIPDDLLQMLAGKATRKTFPAGTFLAKDGEVVENAYIVAEGEVQRWAIIDSRRQHVSTFCDRSVGTLHLYNETNISRFNAECMTDVVAYCLSRTDVDEAMMKTPVLATYLIRSLAAHIRLGEKRFVTPFLEQKGFKTSVTATTMASLVEAYFRSGMNSFINSKLSGTGIPTHDGSFKGIMRAFFPNMAVQVPVRVVYINGIKGLRRMTDTVDVKEYSYPDGVRMLLSFIPGVVMCPFSSVLEAANVTENPLPLYRRWLVGFVPRLAREVIFGIGINQLADYCSTHIPEGAGVHPFVRYCGGSISAGWIAGYFSQFPHSISTLKLMHPQKSYRELWGVLAQRSENHVPEIFPKGTHAHQMAAKAMSIFCPVGMVRRSGQIAGTFLIINGFNYLTRNQDWY